VNRCTLEAFSGFLNLSMGEEGLEPPTSCV
jgi:hypothetical protein